MGIKYRVCVDYINIDNIPVKTYGIELLLKKTVLRKIPDISLDKKAVEALVNDMNEYSVEPEHVDDVIYDFYYTHI